MQIDDADRRLLRQLMAAPNASTAQLADRAGLTEATCWRRLERLRARPHATRSACGKRDEYFKQENGHIGRPASDL
ncbi:AsnC family transcriptional regulator, partial [Roseinatronobacter sp.]|uniref:Lrp/AsnC family transcriptional regulator n=1 Tax=Roseinatronobacter sp. TaxID=1945755 RepID=UPI0025F5E4E2